MPISTSDLDQNQQDPRPKSSCWPLLRAIARYFGLAILATGPLISGAVILRDYPDRDYVLLVGAKWWIGGAICGGALFFGGFWVFRKLDL